MSRIRSLGGDDWILQFPFRNDLESYSWVEKIRRAVRDKIAIPSGLTLRTRSKALSGEPSRALSKELGVRVRIVEFYLGEPLR